MTSVCEVVVCAFCMLMLLSCWPGVWNIFDSKLCNKSEFNLLIMLLIIHYLSLRSSDVIIYFIVISLELFVIEEVGGVIIVPS